jgi:hypothetical protein
LAVSPIRPGKAGQLTVSDLAGVNVHLCELRDAGEISDTVAERMLGTLIRFQLMGSAAWPTARTATIRAKEIRSRGLAVHPNMSRSVAIGPILEAVRQAWAHGRGG